MNPFHDSDYVNKSQEALVEFFEPCGNAAENFHALKKVFDEMSGDVFRRVQGARNFSVAPRWNDCLHARGQCQFDDRIGIVALVGEKRFRRQALYQAWQFANIGEVARRQLEAQWITQRVTNGVNFGVQAATRDANRLGTIFFSAPEDAWCALQEVESIMISSISGFLSASKIASKWPLSHQ